MTYLRDKRVGRENDRRVKLSPEDREEIVRLREEGESFPKIAMRYGVSHTLIQYICKPEIINTIWNDVYFFIDFFLSGKFLCHVNF